MSDEMAEAMRIIAVMAAARRAFDDALDAYNHAAREGDPLEIEQVRRRAFDALAAMLKTIEEAYRFGRG